MSPVANVFIHPSQFPESVRRDLLESLRTRRVNHKFHYDSVKQTNKWLALHQAYSPSRNDDDCAATYDRAFGEAAKRIKARQIHVIGLGCGGGQKDTRLLKLLKSKGRTLHYTPSDVSIAMTLVAGQAARAVVSEKNCFPLVCDLATTRDLSSALRATAPTRSPRLLTFFGMIPNFEPQDILPKLAGLIRRQDTLLFSANLAPGTDYAAGIKRILPQYDNELTHEWLLTFLLDFGVGRGDGDLRFTAEEGVKPLRRVVARFQFRRGCRISVGRESFIFRRGDRIQLFFSYRYTPELLRVELVKHGLRIGEEWITQSGEEGVFLVRRS